MKLALITDQHFGARSDSTAFSEYFERFYENVFFPYLLEHGITNVIDLGDTFDRRKYINYDTLRRCRKYYFDVLKANNIQVDVIVGNHDTYFKNTNEVNSPELLLGDYDNIAVYDEPGEYNYDGLNIAFLPWVCSGNYEQSMQFIENTKAQILFGHLEIQGFEMYRGTFNDHGFDTSVFDKFDMVCTGHFHHRSSRGNIFYLGNPYELTWADFNDPRGFHIFDTDTRELTFIQNPYRMFNKIHYTDANKTVEQVLEDDMEMYRDTFVKVIVHEKNNPYWFDMFIDKLEKTGIADLQVVEDHLNLNLEDDDDIIDEAEDTLTILKKVVSGLDTPVSKKELDSFLTSLYTEALHAE